MSKSILSAILLAACAGCVNIAFTRNPFSDTKIEQIYQSSSMAAGAGIIVAFPQMMSDSPSDYGWFIGNVLTVPCGLLVECDALCEAVIDTVCLPADYFIARSRGR